MNPYTEGYFERGEGSNYAHGCGDDPGWPLTVELIREQIKPEKLLEIGCAKGYFVQHCRAAGIEAVGCDVSNYAIAAAPADVRRYLYLRDVSKAGLPCKAGEMDIVCSWEVLEHFAEPDLSKVFAKIHRALKPGGISLHRIGIAAMAGEDNDATHITMEPRQWWEQLFASLGYTHEIDLETRLDVLFGERDWSGRFFAWRKLA